MDKGTEAQRFVWEGAIPLQINLHESEVTTLPPPPPALVLAPRIGYLHLLIPHIKPFFNSTLPPGIDTVWFEFKGLPLKWYIPTGTLFDLLCAEPERPWNLTVHFRGYPSNILTPCEGEDSVKWSFINSLKEAAYVINGNCKNVMNMSQSDQLELWRSVVNVNLETYLWVLSKLKLNSSILKSEQSAAAETDKTGSVKTGKVPVKLYVYDVHEDFDYLEDAPGIDIWDKISYINRPVEIHGDVAGKCFTLLDAVKSVLPEFFAEPLSRNEVISEDGNSVEDVIETFVSCNISEIKLLRIQGIEPKLEIPFVWVVNNLMNPDRFLHICVYVKIPEPITTEGA